MGLTIVQKSDPKTRKRNPKIGLVLAGGAVSGGGFKLGGLKALDDFLVNRKTTDFDTYAGLSAGSVLATPLSVGISPAEMIKSLEGKSTEIDRFRALDFYSPNLSEFIERPLDYALAVVLYLPTTVADLLREVPKLGAELGRALRVYIRRPSPGALREILNPIVEALWNRRRFPSVLSYLPTGLFDNSSIERYVRHNLKKGGISNDFRTLFRRTKKELYISAMNLDTAERAVFGHDEDTSLTVSEAVQASTALPGFYRPARIRGVDYVDGGVRRTANIDVAIEHGADLVICYNPFRPFSNKVQRRYDKERGRYVHDGPLMADGGLLNVINQVFRTLLHSRLQYGLREYQDDPNFHGDIIVIEPKESDFNFFQLNALAYGQRIRAAQLGYASVTETIERNYDLVKSIVERYGLTMTRREVRQSMDKIREESVEEAEEVLTREVPRRKLRVA
jgi:predicted acylesterase/phospholipase RssA